MSTLEELDKAVLDRDRRNTNAVKRAIQVGKLRALGDKTKARRKKLTEKQEKEDHRFEAEAQRRKDMSSRQDYQRPDPSGLASAMGAVGSTKAITVPRSSGGANPFVGAIPGAVVPATPYAYNNSLGSMNSPGVITVANPPPAVINVSSHTSDETVVECHGKRVLEIWTHKEHLPHVALVGECAIADGLLYIFTDQGWTNLGKKLSEPPPMTDRRGAIRAQKAKKPCG